MPTMPVRMVAQMSRTAMRLNAPELRKYVLRRNKAAMIAAA